jgi:aspartyl protease
MGLAYSGLTSEFTGTDPHKDKSSNRNPYDPIFTTMYKDGLTDSMFSMAIERDAQGTAGGYIAFGGLPPVNYTGDFAKTPIQVTNSPGFSGSGTFLFYTMTPDGFSYGGKSVSQSTPYIVDSGTTLIYAESSLASAINRAFSPSARSSGGLYVVNCNAKAPSFGVTIGGTTFQVNPTDMILDNGDGTCISGVQDGGSGPYILGDVFMKNVVVVFDVGAAEMRFAAHVNY